MLDIGCGTGDYVEVLSDSVRKYIGMDFAPAMIRQAKKNINSTINPFFLVGCAEALPFKDDSFDLIIAIGFIEYFEDPKIPIREIVRVLKPKGTIIIQSFQHDFYKKISKVLTPALIKQVGSYIYHCMVGLPLREPTVIQGAHVDLTYSKDELDRLMKNFGFQKITYLYSNFNVFPEVIRKLLPRAYIGLSEKISHWKPNRFGIFAANYIGRYIIGSDVH
jgi:ubiquinone/menaquinone biosynthesis C-methylase UbiE